ncbi:MAG: hypothetical protein Ct9H90mP3_3140 [Flammeovirgaceae bacterium]|nr:MAG: hypothetical protein Ct9H90mP3_3140 [Flammeovirgaceae bacterium]
MEIIPDPRIKDITYDIYKEQERLLLEIRDFMTDVRLFENRVSKMLEKKTKKQKAYFLR